MFEQIDLFYAASLKEEEKTTEQDLQEKFDDKHKEKKLTPREWRVLELIKHNSFMEHRKTTQREIYEKVEGFEWDYDEKTHDHCVAIWNDIKDINLSYETDKLIISDKFLYWVGNKEETQAFLDKLWNDLCPRLIRYWAYLKKVSRDCQGLLIDRKGNVIDENSQARAFVESYAKQRISED